MRRNGVLGAAIGVSVFIGGVGSALPAWSQMSSTPAPVAQQTTVEVDVIANLIYNSNVAQSSTEIARDRGLTQSDEYAEPTVMLNLGHRLGRQTVFLQGSIGYDLYRINRVLNRERIDLHPGVILLAGPCSGTFDGDYARHQSELSELARIQQALEFNVIKNTEETKRVDVSGSCGHFGLTPTFDVSESWRGNSSPFFQFNNTRTFSSSGGLAYQRPSFGKLSLIGSYSKVVFVTPVAPVGGRPLDEGYDFYSGGLSFERHLGARLDTALSVSYTSLVTHIAGSAGFRGLTLSEVGSYRIDPRLLLRLNFSRATTPSTRQGSSFSVDNALSGEFDYTLTPRILLKAGGSYMHRHYPGVVNPLALDLTEETRATAFGDATYSLRRRMSVGINVTYELRDANYAPLSYNAARVNLALKSTF